MGVYEAPPLFQVSVSWIYKALARRRASGGSTARPQVNHVPPKLLAQHEAIRLKVKAEPDLTLAELRAWLREEHQVSISVRGMWKTLRQLDLIPTALKIDPCPGSTCDGSDTLRIANEEVPGLLAGGDDGFIAVPDKPAELVAAEIVPDVLHRVEFW
jgi:hypothetical protein